MSSRSSIRHLFVALVVVSGCSARAGTATAPARVGPAPEPPVCDTDWDGAAWGLFAGAAPGGAILALSSNEGSGMLGFSLFLIGSIGGFWTGLAIDSARCGVDEQGVGE